MRELGSLTDGAKVWPSTQADGRVLVCVSGLGGDATEWTGVAPALIKFGDVIAVELSTSGPSPSRGGRAPLKTALEGLDHVLGSIPERPVLIAHSMGALASMLTAVSRNPPLGGLVLTAPFVPMARHGRSRVATAADYARHRALFLLDGRRRRQRSSGRRVSRRSRAAALGALAHYGLRPAAFHAMADRVSCPVLLVHGGDDHYVPPAFALAAAARHPAWQLALVEGAGHFPHRDAPAAWLASVDPWLGSLQRQG